MLERRLRDVTTNEARPSENENPHDLTACVDRMNRGTG
jgi:hypothetical protein